MRAYIFLMLGVAAMVAVACTPIYTSHDYDKKVDFTRFKSYSWMEIEHSKARNLSEFQQRSQLATKRIQQDIDVQLAAKGLQKLDQNGDLLVVYYTSANEMLEVSQNTYSRAGMWADSRVGGSANVNESVEGTIIIDLLDAKYKQLVWRGTAEAAHDADAPIEQIYDTVDKAIKKLFENYPPK